MNTKNEDQLKKQIAKSFLIIFFPLLILIISVSYLGYYLQHVNKHEIIIKTQEKNIIGTQKEIASYILQTIVSDLKIISSNYELSLLVDHNFDKKKVALPDNFLSVSKYKGIYDQVRVLDSDGMEKVRVDLMGDMPHYVEEDQLQFKGDRYYFIDTYNLNKDEIYISPLDLNIEHGEVEIPYKPMIRIGAPIYNRKDEKKGVVILNYLAQILIDKIGLPLIW